MPDGTDVQFAAGLVLCGGKSTRMGMAKATLPFGPELMLQRVVRLLTEAVDEVVVVAAEGQALPPLPSSVDIVRDEHPARGPLGGIWAGLNHVAQKNSADAVYATSCDSPFLHPAFVKYVLNALRGHDIAIPTDEKFLQPLSAAYRVTMLPQVQALIESDRLRPVFLLENANALRLPLDKLADALKASDPELRTLINMNDPAAYRDALHAAGFSLAPAVATQLGLS